jgi:hypothetical protein
MPPAAELDLSPAPPATISPDVGDVVFVGYWRPFPLPGRDDNGQWEFAGVRVVSAGLTTACVEVDNPSVMAGSSPAGSSLRFVELTRLFASRDEIETAVRLATGPDKFPDRDTVLRELHKAQNPNPVG